MNTLSSNHNARLHRALLSLDGLSVGDAFGDQFFIDPHTIFAMIEARDLPPSPWRWSDDTEMAQAIVTLLRDDHTITPKLLAHEFATRFDNGSGRGYGGGAVRILQAVLRGEPWDIAASSVFDGTGSKGNGAAMRAAPLGAYFADDLTALHEQILLSTLPTHTHPDGQAGAYAVALAAALILRLPEVPTYEDLHDVLTTVHHALSDCPTRDRIGKACNLSFTMRPETVSPILGNGRHILSEDTVAFSLWSALKYLDNFEEAMWNTLSVLGDRDTTCAIVGGLVSLRSSPPAAWVTHREPLDLRRAHLASSP